jgi:hypothetical protein
MFGLNENDKYLQDFEYLDLKNPDAEFKELIVEGNH